MTHHPADQGRAVGIEAWREWAGDNVQDDAPDDCLGSLDDFLTSIMVAVGADSGDIYESYDPLLDRVAEVVGNTIRGLMEHMTPEQIAAFNEDYVRTLGGESRG